MTKEERDVHIREINRLTAERDNARQTMRDMERDRTSKVITDSRQACYLHGEHDRCTNENTLGTQKCACAKKGHK